MALTNKSIIRNTLILGIGNILRKDDGVGIHVINKLKEKDLSSDVRLLDGGTAGLDLLTHLEDVDRLIIVDAMLTADNPGTINVFPADELNSEKHSFSGHSHNITDIIDMSAALWKRPEAVIVGIIPKDCESYEIGLSKDVEDSVDKAVQIIMELLL
jgi:hydrogenase maturation protease